MRLFDPVRILPIPLLLALVSPCALAAVPSLVIKSPFLPPEFNPPGEAGPDAAMPAASSRFEFRGVYQMNGRYYFNLFDHGSRKARWVNQTSQQSGLPQIVDFKENRNVLVIEVEGTRFELQMLADPQATAGDINLLQHQQDQISNIPTSPARQGTAIRRPVIRSGVSPSSDATARRILFRKPTTSN